MQEPASLTFSSRRYIVKSCSEEIKLVVRSRTDPDATVQGCDARHAHEDPAGDQGIEQPLGEGAIAAAIDGHEIGGRSQGSKALLTRDRPDALTRPFHL